MLKPLNYLLFPLLISSGLQAKSMAPIKKSEFQLSWSDDFNVFDKERWSKADWTFDVNIARFSEDNVTIDDGHLVLTLKKEETVDADGENPRSYTGGEIYSTEVVKYGRFEMRMKAAAAR